MVVSKKVSVIVPVYNGEEHLRECMDSIVNQTLHEIEIICVNDGSTDSSESILKEYAANDPRVHVITQEKSDAGTARNRGKQDAVGEYLIFWDCDDFFDLRALERMYHKAAAQKADICVCGANQYFAEKGELAPNVKYYVDTDRIPVEPVFNRHTNEDHILTFTSEAVWNKMYRRAFIEEKGLNFQQQRNGNDVFFTIVSMCLADRVTTVDKALVTYRKNQLTSLVGTMSQAPLNTIYAWISAADYLIEADAFPERSFTNKAVGSLMYLLRNMRQRDAFYTAVAYLKMNGLRRLHIREREEGYYYSPRYADFVSHLIHDSIEDFQCWLSFATYVEMTEKTIGPQKLKATPPGKVLVRMRKVMKKLAKLIRKGAHKSKNCTNTVHLRDTGLYMKVL